MKKALIVLCSSAMVLASASAFAGSGRMVQRGAQSASAPSHASSTRATPPAARASTPSAARGSAAPAAHHAATPAARH